MLSAATWVRMRCRWKSGTTIIWENSAGRSASTIAEAAAQGRRRRLAEHESDHEAHAPHLVEELVALDQRLERLGERLPGALDPVEDVLVVEGGQGGEPGDHRQLVLC